jgi:hypothetical protein
VGRPSRDVPRAVIALEHATQPVQTGEQHALGDVRLVELVAHFPFQLRRDDDLVRQGAVRADPVVHLRRRAAHQREERVLVDDALV